MCFIQGGIGVRKLLCLPLLAVAALAGAQEPVKLYMSDIVFQWRPMQHGSMMCGYAIRGNHLNRANPKTEWDINVDEIIQGDVRVSGVSAGAFLVNGKKRTPKAPITALIFTTEDDAQPLPVQLVGAPNRDNGVRGALDPARAAAFFKALSNYRKIAATINYADGSTDHLQFSGFRDERNFGGGKNSPFDECLRGRTPKPGDPDWNITLY
jgi:hypothetical protein